MIAKIMHNIKGKNDLNNILFYHFQIFGFACEGFFYILMYIEIYTSN